MLYTKHEENLIKFISVCTINVLLVALTTAESACAVNPHFIMCNECFIVLCLGRPGLPLDLPLNDECIIDCTFKY